jgi:hypothetical protein
MHALINEAELYMCAAGFALLNLPKGKSLGRSKPKFRGTI